MARTSGGYIGLGPGYSRDIKPGVWTIMDQYATSIKGEWIRPSDKVAFNYILKNASDNPAGRSFVSNLIEIPREPYTYLTVVFNAGFPNLTTPGWVEHPGDDGWSYSGPAIGVPRPKCAIWYRYKVPTILTVTSVDANGVITGYTTQKGKGVRTPLLNKAVDFTGGNGTGAKFVIHKDTQKLIDVTLSNGGTGYKVGDRISWVDSTEINGEESTMDEDWDILLHGVGADGKHGQKDLSDPPVYKSWAYLTTGAPPATGIWDNNNQYPDTPAAIPNNKPWAIVGKNAAYDREWSNYEGGASGSGWGVGVGGGMIGSNGAGSQCGGDGCAGYSVLNTQYIPNGQVTTQDYGTSAMELHIKGQIYTINGTLETIPL